LPISLSCICTVDQRRLAEETSCGDSVRSQSNPIQASAPWGGGTVLVWSPKGSRTLFCTQLRGGFHGVGGHQEAALCVLRQSGPEAVSRARHDHGSGHASSPIVPMQHHLAKQRAMSPCSMSVDSPHTPAVRRKRQLHRGATEAKPRSTRSGIPALPLASHSGEFQ